jgi:hypothetical protein
MLSTLRKNVPIHLLKLLILEDSILKTLVQKFQNIIRLTKLFRG